MLGIVSYGGGSYTWKRAAQRLQIQLEKTVTKEVKFLVYKNLKEVSIPEVHMNFIKRNFKGGGYWLWKPYIILDFLRREPNVTSILYLDAGCEVGINVEAPELKLLENQILERDAIFFEMFNIPEYSYSNSISIETLGSSEADLHSPQISGTIFLMKRKFAESLCQEWIDLMQFSNYSLLTSEESKQGVNFVAHRHDQSVLSLLIKKKHLKSVLIKELGIVERSDLGIRILRNRSRYSCFDRRTFVTIIKFIERIYSRTERAVLKSWSNCLNGFHYSGERSKIEK